MTHLKTKRLAAYRNALLRTFSLLTFLAFTILISLPEVSNAQCPDGTWTYDQTQVIIPNTTCIVTVYYCWKYDDATHTLNEIIETIVPNSDNACNSLSAPAIIQAVVANFETTPPIPGSVTVPDCGTGESVVVSLQAKSCWHMENSFGPGDPRNPPNPPCNYCSFLTVCPDASSYCGSICSYCMQAGVLTQQSCTYQNVWNSDCTSDPTIQNIPWGNLIVEQCYNMNPCGNQ